MVSINIFFLFYLLIHLSLKITVQQNDVFLSTDAFYVEVVLNNAGGVKDVKVAHHDEPFVSILASEIFCMCS